jgi:hypothetical protein
MKKLILGSLLLLAAGAGPLLAEEVQTLPPAVYGQMKKGVKADKVWRSPKFDGGKGFVMGKVSTLVDSPDANVIDYFPSAMARYAIPGSPNVLNLSLVGLEPVSKPTVGRYAMTMEVEGQILDESGEPVFAFRTREKVDNRENLREDTRAVMDRIAWILSKELGKDYEHALLVKNEVVTGVNPSGLVAPPPPTAQQPQDIQSRLLRLDDLKKKGLITEEEYKQHRDEILKGL